MHAPPNRTSLTALVLLVAGACTATPDQPLPPPLSVATDHYVGSVRTGSISALDPIERAQPWSAELRIALAAEAPAGTGTPLSAIARHVFLERGDETLETRSELALGALLLAAGPLPPSLVWAERRIEAVFDGATTIWRTASNPDTAAPLETTWSRFDVQVSRGADGAEVALVLEGLVTPRSEDDEGETLFGEPVLQREHVVLGPAPALDGSPYRLFLPAPRAEAPRGGLIVELRLSTAEAEGFELAAARGLENLERARLRALEQASGLTSSESFHFESQSALRALESEQLQRPALVFLAQQTGAQLTGELALSADEEVLGGFLSTVRARLAEGVHIDEPLALGWFLDETAYRWMTAIAEDAERALPAELRALLLVHTGQLGRYPDLVREVVEESGGLAALEARLVQENRIFLEDSHPAARVRAFDWLAVRAGAPADYDPLGSRTERRLALSAAEGGE